MVKKVCLAVVCVEGGFSQIRSHVSYKPPMPWPWNFSWHYHVSKVYCFKVFSNQMKIDRMFSICLSRCNSWQFNNIIKDHSQFLVMCHQTNHLHYGLETFFRCYPFIKSVLFWRISNLNHQFKKFLCKKFYVVSLKLLSTAGGLEPVILSSTIHCTTSCVKGLLCQ